MLLSLNSIENKKKIEKKRDIGVKFVENINTKLNKYVIII